MVDQSKLPWWALRAHSTKSRPVYAVVGRCGFASLGTEVRAVWLSPYRAGLEGLCRKQVALDGLATTGFSNNHWESRGGQSDTYRAWL